MINWKRALKEKIYLISGNAIIRTIPSEDSVGFIAYRKTPKGDFELEPDGNKLNEEIAQVFTNSLTMEISKEVYNNKTVEELYKIYMDAYSEKQKKEK